MACFSLAFLVQILVWLIVVGAVVAIVQLLIPRIIGPLGEMGGTVVAVLKIILWAVVLIFLVYLAFDLISCALYGARPMLR
jgi:hypothetical protein